MRQAKSGRSSRMKGICNVNCPFVRIANRAWVGVIRLAKPRLCEGVSRNVNEPDSASLHYLRVANLPELAKPAIDDQATDACGRRTLRGGWGRRMSIDRSRNLGGPAGRTTAGLAVAARLRGIHNPKRGSGRESDRPIVVRTRGNARRAKGPDFKHVSNNERSAD